MGGRVTSRSCSIQHGIQLVSQGVKHGANVVQNVLGRGRCGATSRGRLNGVHLLPHTCTSPLTVDSLPGAGVTTLPLQRLCLNECVLSDSHQEPVGLSDGPPEASWSRLCLQRPLTMLPRPAFSPPPHPAPGSPLSLLSANALLGCPEGSCQGGAGLLQSLLGPAGTHRPSTLRPRRRYRAGANPGSQLWARKCQLSAGHRHRLGSCSCRDESLACDLARCDPAQGNLPGACLTAYLLQAL